MTPSTRQPDWGGLNPASVGWLGTADSKPAIEICGYLVGQEDWNLLRNPENSQEPALILHGGKTGLIMVPAHSLSCEDMAKCRDLWFARLKQLPKTWRRVSLLFLSSEPPTEEQKALLQKTESKGFLSKTLTPAWLNACNDQVVGTLPEILQKAVASPQECSLGDLHDRLKNQDDRMRNFLALLSTTKSWGTYLIMAVCVAVFAWTTAAGGSENTFVLLRFGANFRPLTLDAEQWWRLIGSAFLHIGWIHLLVNMYSLYAVGPTLEKFMGNLRYLTLYALSATAGSLASVLLGAPHVSAGASGAIFGLFGACAVLGYRHRRVIPKPIQHSLVNGMVPAIVYNLLYGFSVDGIDNAAHLGGLFAGGITAFLVQPKIARERLSRPLQLVFASFAAAMFATQALTLSHAADGFNLEELPAREIHFSNWTAQLPELFELSQDGTYYEGPGINFFANVAEQTLPSSDLQDPAQLIPTLSKEVGFALTYDRELQADGRTWYLFQSSEKVTGRYALTVDGFQRTLLGAFVAPGADREAEEVIKTVLPSVSCSLHEANQALAAKDYKRAIELFQKAVASPTESTAALLGLTYCYLELGQHEEALQTLNQLVDKTPKSAALIRIREKMLVEMGRSQDAIADTTTLLELVPEGSQEWLTTTHRRAQLAYRCGKDALADEDINTVLRSNDQNLKSLAYNTRAWQRALTGDTENALTDINEALKIKAEPSFLDTRSFIQLKRKSYEEALKDANSVLQQRPDSGHSWYLKGSSLARLGRKAEAEAALRAALEFPETPTAPYHRSARDELEAL